MTNESFSSGAKYRDFLLYPCWFHLSFYNAVSFSFYLFKLEDKMKWPIFDSIEKIRVKLHMFLRYTSFLYIYNFESCFVDGLDIVIQCFMHAHYVQFFFTKEGNKRKNTSL